MLLHQATAAIAAKQSYLTTQFDIAASELHYVDGSSGGDTTATNEAVIAMLLGMSTRPSYGACVESQPRVASTGRCRSWPSSPPTPPARGDRYSPKPAPTSPATRKDDPSSVAGARAIH